MWAAGSGGCFLDPTHLGERVVHLVVVFDAGSKALTNNQYLPFYFLGPFHFMYFLLIFRQILLGKTFGLSVYKFISDNYFVLFITSVVYL